MSMSRKGRVSPMKGRRHNVAALVKMSVTRKGHPFPSERRVKMKGPKSVEHRAKISTALKGRLLSPTHIANIMKALHVHPNKAEACLFKILQRAFPGEFAYTGDGSVIVGGKCPDFTNVSGKKQVVELFGDYWHRGENPQLRVDHFAKFGFHCVVVWEHELGDEREVVRKVGK